MNSIRVIRVFIVIWLLFITGFSVYFYAFPGSFEPFLARGVVEIIKPEDWAPFMGMYYYFFGFLVGSGLLLVWVYPKPKEREQLFYAFALLNVTGACSRVIGGGGSGEAWTFALGECFFPVLMAWLLYRAPDGDQSRNSEI